MKSRKLKQIGENKSEKSKVNQVLIKPSQKLNVHKSRFAFDKTERKSWLEIKLGTLKLNIGLFSKTDNECWVWKKVKKKVNWKFSSKHI